MKCVKCGSHVKKRRVQLGYKICLECGAKAAAAEAMRRAGCVAPAFNKGAYQPVFTLQDAKDVGR